MRQDLGTAYETFRHDNERWLSDYALFRALKAKYNGTYYLDWPIELVKREPSALAQARQKLAREIDKLCFAQFLLFRQADQLKQYAHAKSIRLIGDLPFFVSPDSSDAWTDPELFILDERHRPSPNELARSRGRQLALALHGRHVVRASSSRPSRTDSQFQAAKLTWSQSGGCALFCVEIGFYFRASSIAQTE